MTVDHASHLYSLSHFGPPSIILETRSPFSWDFSEVNSGFLNLCVVPKTIFLTSTPPPPIQIPSLTLDYYLALPSIATPVIEPPIVVVEDISEDTDLLLDDRFITPIIPPPLQIPFEYSHA